MTARPAGLSSRCGRMRGRTLPIVLVVTLLGLTLGLTSIPFLAREEVPVVSAAAPLAFRTDLGGGSAIGQMQVAPDRRFRVTFQPSADRGEGRTLGPVSLVLAMPEHTMLPVVPHLSSAGGGTSALPASCPWRADGNSGSKRRTGRPRSRFASNRESRMGRTAWSLRGRLALHHAALSRCHDAWESGVGVRPHPPLHLMGNRTSGRDSLRGDPLHGGAMSRSRRAPCWARSSCSEAASGHRRDTGVWAAPRRQAP